MTSRLPSRYALTLILFASLNAIAGTPKSLGSVFGSPTGRQDPQFAPSLPAKERAALWIEYFEKTDDPLKLQALSNDLLKMILGGGDQDLDAAVHIYALHLAERARPSLQINPESMKRVKKLSGPRPGLEDFIQSILLRVQEKTKEHWKTFAKAVTDDAINFGLDKETLQSFGKSGSVAATTQALYLANERRAISISKVSPAASLQKFSTSIQNSALIQQLVRVYQGELEHLMANPLTNGILTEEVTPKK